MRIGVRGHDFGRYSPEGLAEALSGAGVEAVQLALQKAIEGVGSYYDVSDELLERLKTALAANDIEPSVLGCYIEPAAKDAGEREQQLRAFSKGIYCAAALDAKCIGTETTDYRGEESGRVAAFDILSRSVERMLSEAAKLDVTVAVEPVAWHTLNSPELTALLLDRFAGSGLSVIFDPSNLFPTTAAGDQNKLWQDCIDAFGDKVVAMHIKDGLLENGLMKPCLLGDGVIDYSSVIVPWLRAKKPDIALLREEISPISASRDLEWMRRVFLS